MKFIAGYITRKSLVNKTAVGHVNYALNHVQGCAHGCRYPCFAYLMAMRFGKVTSYEQWCRPYIVENALQLLSAELPKLKDKTDKVHLCFATDPFMYEYEEIAALSIQIIRQLNMHGIACAVLTKGILPFELSGLSPSNEYGISLVSLQESYRQKHEPGAAPYQDRIQALHRLHIQGCKTYVNIEPYPAPDIIKQDIAELLEAIGFVDWIGFGKNNYNKQDTKHAAFYSKVREDIAYFCSAKQIACYIHG